MATRTKKSNTTTQPEIIIDEEVITDGNTDGVLPIVEELLKEQPEIQIVEEQTQTPVADVKKLEALIIVHKEAIKELNKKIREITKPESIKSPNKKQLALNWFNSNPKCSLKEFVVWAMDALEISPVYSSTLYKSFKK